MKMHDEYLTVVDYFNGQLNDEEKKAFETHLKGCPECREALNEMEALNEEIANQLQPIEAPDGMEERIFNQIDKTDEQHSNSEKDMPPPVSKRKYMHPAYFFTACALLLISLSGNIFLLSDDNEPPETSTIETMDITSEDNSDMHASIELHQLEDGKQAVSFEAFNFIGLEPGEVYQIWLFENGQPHRAGTLVPNSDGEATVLYTLEDATDDIEWDQIRVTIEDSPHHSLPEGDVVMSSDM